jgi:hypothetical protein
MRRFFCGMLLLPILVGAVGHSAERTDGSRLAAQVSPHRLVQMTRELSGFEGRQAGTPGGSAAEAYIAKQLREVGLQTFPSTTIQVIPPLHVKIETDTQSRSLVNGKDFIPVLSGGSASLDSVPIVFVGYGIVDPANHVDDYHGVSATGNVVLFFRGQPGGYPGRATHQEKVRTAQANGARAYLTVTGPLLSSYERRRGLSQRPMALYADTVPSVPGVWIDPAIADILLQPAHRSLESLQAEADSPVTRRPVDTGSKLTIKMEQRQAKTQAANLWAFSPGSDPDLRDETVVLGAHYDHFGAQAGAVFAGADDNASGTAVILEIARVLAATEFQTKRSILFIAFAGEEQGLLGSRYYVSHPVKPLTRTRAMINVDHAGVGNGRVTVGLSRIERSSAEAAGEQAGVLDQLDLVGLFPGGDHVPFVEAGIPTATIVSSGSHPDFHQPSDTADKIKSEILAGIARYTLALLLHLANGPL